MKREARTLTVALGQWAPGGDLDDNLAIVERLAVQAAEAGAQWLLLPEYATFLHARRREMVLAAQRAAEVERRLCALAAAHGLWLLVGSLAAPAGGERLANRSLLIDSQGRLAARYDKLHMFDADLPGGVSIRESIAYAPGNEAVVVETPWAHVGLSICYDLRFPQLYRALAQAGAEVLVVPAAFMPATGAHWQPLLSARAIECGAYVLAPAACGQSAGGRTSHGHSLIVNPWGEVVAALGEGPGCLIHRLSLDEVADARARLPSLRHDRPFDLRVIAGASFPNPETSLP